MGRFLQNLVGILYPPVCPMCGRVVQGTGGRSVACRDCRRSLMYVGQNHCMKCGKPLDEENGELCFDCEKNHHGYIVSAGMSHVRQSCAGYRRQVGGMQGLQEKPYVCWAESLYEMWETFR